MRVLFCLLFAGCAGETSEMDDQPEVALYGAFDGPWTSVSVPLAGPYGERTFEVPAAQSWVNTGVFLREGERATINASGRWSPLGAKVGARGHADGELERGCALGSLVARVGLHLEDELSCIKKSGTITASKSGVLYVGALVASDLGESYEARMNASGSLTVTVQSDGATVPTLSVEEALQLDILSIESDWMEIRADPILLTLPTEIVNKDRATLASAVNFLRDIYSTHTELRGRVPFLSQPIRFYQDKTIDDEIGAYMLAGNPIRVHPLVVSGGKKERITRAGQPGNDVWGVAHELGHTFTLVDGKWYYMSNDTTEAWPNLFTLYSLQKLEHPDGERAYCDGKESYLANPDYEGVFTSDPFLQLCFLMEFQRDFGWQLYKDFYGELDSRPHNNQLVGVRSWTWTRDVFNTVSTEDTTPYFERWGIPLSP